MNDVQVIVDIRAIGDNIPHSFVDVGIQHGAILAATPRACDA
jgi:hypothetical protein